MRSTKKISPHCQRIKYCHFVKVTIFSQTSFSYCHGPWSTCSCWSLIPVSLAVTYSVTSFVGPTFPVPVTFFPLPFLTGSHVPNIFCYKINTLVHSSTTCLCVCIWVHSLGQPSVRDKYILCPKQKYYFHC